MTIDTESRPASEKTPYLADYGLLENPFRTTPSARYTYLTLSTKEALAHGNHLIESRRGLGVISGEIGTGKTTLCRVFAEEAQDGGNSVVMLYRVPGGARQTESKLVAAIAGDLDLPASSGRSAERGMKAIEDHAIAAHQAGHTTVILIDEAHRLRRESIEVIKSLLMLQTNDEQLVQVLLFGQLPELLDVIKLDAALHSRLAVHTRLNPLLLKDVRAMIAHRLHQAGRDEALFTPKAIESLYERSSGIPRKICTIADHATMLAYDESAKMVDKPHVIRSADDLLHEPAGDE